MSDVVKVNGLNLRREVTAAQTAAEDAADQAATAATSATAAETARNAAEALVISDLGTTDGQTRALIEAPASQTAIALSATFARPQRVFVSPTGDNANSGLLPGLPKATIAAALTTLSGGGVVQLTGQTHVVTAGFVLDGSTHAILGAPGAVIDATALSSGQAIRLTGSQPSPYQQTRQVLSDVEIVGPGPGGATDGLYFHEPTSVGQGPSHFTLDRVNVHGFRAGYRFGDRAYALQINDCDTWNNGWGLDLNAATDGGERISLSGGAVFNNTLGALRSVNPTADVTMVNVSIDYNGQGRQFDLTNTTLTLLGCHVESSQTLPDAAFVLNGTASVAMIGGSMLLTGSPGSGAAGSVTVENNAVEGAGARFIGVHMQNLRRGSGAFASGTGSTVIRHSTSPDIADIAYSMGAANNLLTDGDMENPAVFDDWFVGEDTATITNRLVGTNLSIAKSTTTARSGTRSLKLTKVGGAGTTATACLMIPVQAGQKLIGELYYAKPGAASGQFSIFLLFLSVDPIRTVAPDFFRRTTVVGTSTITVPAGAVGWTPIRFNEPTRRVPSWATHYLVSFNLAALNGGGDGIYVDDAAAALI